MSTEPARGGQPRSPRRPVWLFAGALIVLLVTVGAGLALRLRGGPRPSEAATPAAQLQAAELEERMVMLQAQVRSLERRAAQQAQRRQHDKDDKGDGRGGLSALSDRDDGAGVPSPEPRRKPADDEDRRQYFATLEARLVAEPRDPSWAPATEDKLRRAGDALPASLKIAATRCGQASCRLELTRDPAQATPTALTTFVQSVAGILPEIVVEYPEDPTKVVLHLQRDGAGGFPALVGAAESEPGQAPPAN